MDRVATGCPHFSRTSVQVSGCSKPPHSMWSSHINKGAKAPPGVALTVPPKLRYPLVSANSSTRHWLNATQTIMADEMANRCILME